MVSPLVALTVAGTDSGGGAGIAADLATFAAFGIHGTAVVTAVTAQDTTAVYAVHVVPLDVVRAQFSALLEDLPPAVIKTGMLASAEVARLLADAVVRLRPTTVEGLSRTTPLVVDPVLRATTGAALADADLVAAYLENLLPVATVVTPNAAEARVLLGLDPSAATPPRDLATALADRLAGPAVVLTGGPAPDVEGARTCTDWLAAPGAEPVAIAHPAIATINDHGTGCTYASALASRIALGDPLPAAAERAAAYVTHQLTLSTTWTLGRGRGPVAHLTKEIPA